jgi:soluble lytic murein transglycosylase
LSAKRDRYAASAALSALLLVLSAGTQAAPQGERLVPLPRPRPPLAAVIPVPPTSVAAKPLPLAIASTQATSRADLDAVKKAVEAAQRDRGNNAEEISKSIADPVARKLVEWVILRLEDEEFSFQRYSSFVTANPGWPNTAMFRRKAEAALWQVPTAPEIVRSYFARSRPISAKGRLAYARALLAQGDRALAQQYVREAWRYDAMTDDLERQALEAFGPLITDSDHKARMDRRFYAEDEEAGMRAAERLGGTQLAIGKARKAVIERSRHAHALLEAVPESARKDAGYMFSRIQWLRRADKIAEAAKWMNAAPNAPNVILNPAEWWTERRLIARGLLDLGEYQAAYKIAAEACEPAEENPRVEAHFTAGWIALRFVKNPAAALAHFTRINQAPGMHPTSIARGHYWMGRAAEALGRQEEARRHYQDGARYPAAYYGQLARARLGLGGIVLPPTPHPSAQERAALSRLEVVRAAQILYEIDEPGLVVSMAADLADRQTDPDVLAMLAEIAMHHKDARTVLQIGQGALARGLPFEMHAFPIVGLPRYTPVGEQVEPAIAYSIARQESGFNPGAVSRAKAYGLMQVTAGTGKLIAKRHGIPFNAKRLLSDPAYNVQLGAAELGDVLEDYRGSYILAFVAYNAGRGRVKQWIERYGDPRDPDVDPIDWVERIPFSETRNYVQRILENMQVYRVRFGSSRKLLIEADLRRGTNGH